VEVAVDGVEVVQRNQHLAQLDILEERLSQVEHQAPHRRRPRDREELAFQIALAQPVAIELLQDIGLEPALEVDESALQRLVL